MTVIGSTAQDRDAAAERTKAFERAHLSPLRRHPELKRDGKQFQIARHEAQRMTGVYDIKVPFAHAHLLVTLALPIRRRQPPELYVGHQEGWNGFAPRLESLFRYDPDDPATTVAIFLELRQKATAFQLQLLRDNLLVADEVKGAFDTLFQVMQDQLQVFAASTEVLWAVEVSTFLPNPENEPREERLLLKGKTPMGELAKTKCIMDLYGECVDFFKNWKGPLNLPPYKGQRLDEHVEACLAKFQEAVLMCHFLKK